MSAFLALEDGTIFRGGSVGAPGVAFGEAVFTTAMTGYQETVTDPSFAEQLVCFTAPMVGNYGVASGRAESPGAHAKAVLMREARGPEWTDWLEERGIVGLTGIDTRSLVLRLREGGAMRAAAVAAHARRGRGARGRPRAAVDGRRCARRAGLDPRAVRLLRAGPIRIAVVDYGCKRSILRRLAGAGARVTVFPHAVDADELAGYDGVLLSNGPGDPEPLGYEVAGRARPARARARARDLPRPPAARPRDRPRDVQAPLRPPRREPPGARPAHAAASSSRARTTASRSRPSDEDEATHVSLYDGTVEGFDFPELRARSVQFHPEAGPGPARRLADPRTLGRGGARCRVGHDLRSICLIGSGPIVIGQACEFDYAGCQALKVLREDGFRTIVVNSNPATIMTDPGFADRTYLEPLDLEGVADVLGRERPDALLPTLGGQTALNLAIELADEGILDDARRRAPRRAGRRDPARRGPRALPRGGAELRPEGAELADRHVARRPRPASPCRPSCVPRSRSAATAAASSRPRGRAARPGRARACARARSARCSSRSRVARLGRVRARGDPRPARQRRHRLLDREPRPDGRPHRRLGHRRAADDALRRGLPGAARRGDRRRSAPSASRPAARTSSSRATARPATCA